MENETASDKRPWLLILLLGIIPLWNHPYFEELRSPNPLSRTYLTRALVDHHSVSIEDVEREWGGVMDRARRGAHTYCDKAPGSSFLLVPVYAVLKAVSPGRVEHRPLLMWGSLWLGVFPTLLALACLDALMLWLGLLRSTRRVALCAWGLGSVGVPFELLFFGHQLAACMIVFALWAGVAAVRTGKRPAMMLAGLAAGLAVITEYPSTLLIVFVAALCAALWVRQRGAAGVGAFVVWVTLGAALPLGLGMAYHQAAFGGPLTTGYAFIENPFFASIHHKGLMGISLPKAEGLFGTLLSSNRGLFYFQPYLLLFPVGLAVWWRDRQRAWAAALGAALLVYGMFAAGFGYWLGGWSLGPRHLVPAVPLAVLAFARALDGLEKARPGMASLVRGLVVWSITVVGLACMTHSGYPEELVHPFFEMTLPLAVGGYFPYSLGTALGLSRQAAAVVPGLALAGTVIAVCVAGRNVEARASARLHAALPSLVAAVCVTCASWLVQPSPSAVDRVAWIFETVWEPRAPGEPKTADPVKVEPHFSRRPATQTDRLNVGRYYARRGEVARALEEYVRGCVEAAAGRR